MSENLTHAALAENLNTKFIIRYGDADTVELELTEISSPTVTRRQEFFSILFRGPRDRLLPQWTYRVEHDTFGQFDLFIVPVEQDKNGCYYQAVFNRLKLNPPDDASREAEQD